MAKKAIKGSKKLGSAKLDEKVQPLRRRER
jgi:hypothetical protein